MTRFACGVMIQAVRRVDPVRAFIVCANQPVRWCRSGPHATIWRAGWKRNCAKPSATIGLAVRWA